MCLGGRDRLPSLLLPPLSWPGLGGRREGGEEGVVSQGMGGGLLWCPLPEEGGGVGGVRFPVVGEVVKEVGGGGLGGLVGGVSSSSVALVFWSSEPSKNEGKSLVCFLCVSLAV